MTMSDPFTEVTVPSRCGTCTFGAGAVLELVELLGGAGVVVPDPEANATAPPPARIAAATPPAATTRNGWDMVCFMAETFP